MKKKYIFDNNFYVKFYPDIKLSTENEDTPLDHYNKHGINEKRICCQEELNDIIYKNMKRIKTQSKLLLKTSFQNPENKLNILIRTSMRPSFFKVCINSILEQQYSNYHIYICYDNVDSLYYLYKYNMRHKNMTIFYIENDSTEKYKFNLYNNELMNMVEDGYIIFLDDDDKFTHNMCLKIINENITDEDSILMWKFMRPDKLVYPKNIDDIKLGEIDTTCVCFHNKHKHLSQWNDKQCGDYYFYSRLFKKLKEENNNFRIKKVNYILTKTIYNNKSCNSL